MELMPRSDKARLIDFVKFKGVVDGSRKSEIEHCQTESNFVKCLHGRPVFPSLLDEPQNN